MSSAGFGVCGHKNSFSTGVKIGNYVEDRIGRDLARSGRAHPISKTSECSGSYTDPATMPDKCVNAPKENPSERSMLRQGLPYDILFEHGRAHIPTALEQQHKYTPTSRDFGRGTIVAAAPSRAKHLEIQRATMAREAKHMYVTTAQSVVPVHMHSKP